MKNLITPIKNNFCLPSGRYDCPRSGRFLSNICVLCLIVLAPIVSVDAKDQKPLKADAREGKVSVRPRSARSTPAAKPALVRTRVRHAGETLLAATEIQSVQGPISSITTQQLAAKVSAARKTSADYPIYTGTYSQRVPQVASDGNEFFVAFENSDTTGGYLFGRISIYHSVDGGSTWNFWRALVNSSYWLHGPQIQLVGEYVVVSYLSGGNLFTARWTRGATDFNTGYVPAPVISVDEYIADYRMVSDVESGTMIPWLYIAYLFRQTDGKYKVLFSSSMDTAASWADYDFLGLSQGELNATSVGLDYATNGSDQVLYLAYLGTDANAGNIMFRQSWDWGITWDDEFALPVDVYGGSKRKVGPVVSAVGDRVAVVYQYDAIGDATDWKTGSDFDILAVVSYDEGGSWGERAPGYTYHSEILPWISHDADGDFYVSFIRDGRVRISMAGEEIAFSTPDSAGALNSISLDDFPSIVGNNISGARTAYTTWTATTNAYDIYGASIDLKIPPLSPSDLAYSVVSSTEIDLNWTDNSLDETAFRIYADSGATGENYKQLGIVGSNVTTFQATGLNPGTTYGFYVRAFNAYGGSLRTDIVEATTNGSSGNPPAAPSGLTASVVSASEIDLYWTDNSDDESGFRIQRSLDGSSYTNIASPGANVTSYQDHSVVPGTTYYYRACAYNTNGNSVYSNVSSATTPSGGNPPLAPYGLTADAVSASEINLNWTDNSSDEDGFTIERSTDNFSTFANLTSVGPNVTNYHDHSVNASTTYYYRVFAYSNANGSSDYSDIASATTPAAGGPTIAHTPSSIEVNVNNGVASQAVAIFASAQDPDGVQAMYLEYEQVGQPTIYHLDFPSPYNLNQSVQIPAGMFVNNGQAIGVTYRIVAINALSQTTRTLWYSINVRNGSGISIQPTITFPVATNYPNNFTQAYRIFSIPFDLDDKRPSILFPNNFGDHAKNGTPYVNWRLQRVNNGSYQDYEDFKDEAQALAPGNGFFLLLRDQKTLTLGGNKVSNADVMYNTGVQLSGGISGNTGGNWYLLGDPLNETIMWDSLYFVGATPLDHAFYSGTGPVSGWEKTTSNANTLRPWEGLAIKTSGPCTVRFRTLPPRSSIHEDQGITPGMVAASLAKAESSPDDWLITVDAYRPDINMRCEGGGVGMRNGADIDHDRFDSYLPPIVGEKTVALGFSGPNGPRLRDIRPLSADGGVWAMQVITRDAKARVRLQFGGVAKLPNPAFTAYLIDLDQKKAYDLKEVSSLEINSGDGIRNFNVAVGTQSYVEQNNAGVELKPSSMKLYSNYPNPFNPETVIGYAIPSAAGSYRVTLKVHNMLGQVVATLVSGSQTSGYYEVKFDGRRQSSGVYFYTLTVSDGLKTYTDSKKMMLLR
jgi:hypothetical protein